MGTRRRPGQIGVDTLKQWVANHNVITMTYDATAKQFHINNVEGDIAAAHGTPILADGSVQMEPTYEASHAQDVATIKTIREFRHTVTQAVAGHTISKAECIAAFKQLPHFDWAKDDDFYIQDATGKVHYFLVKYRANGDTAETGTDYVFWYDELKAAA